MIADFVLPTRGKGRPTARGQAVYHEQCQCFAARILEIEPTVGFRLGTRGWCYLLESLRLVDKGDFDRLERLFTDLRKSGELPLDICVEDDAREWVGVEDVAGRNIDDHAADLFASLDGWISEYLPFSFWDDKDVYIQMLVEKVDLRELFGPVCRRFRVPIANGKGWGNLHVRAQMMERFAQHEGAGRQGILLYCGDFDPTGLNISDFLRSNMADLSRAVGGWQPDQVIIDRFGLNYDFILANKLTWIDNLQTGSREDLSNPRHPQHHYPYVQDYLSRYGVRKVEANALVVRVAEARKLCHDAILRYLPDEQAPSRFEERLRPWRDDLRVAVHKRIT